MVSRLFAGCVLDVVRVDFYVMAFYGFHYCFMKGCVSLIVSFHLQPICPQAVTLQGGCRDVILAFLHELHAMQFVPAVAVNDFIPAPGSRQFAPGAVLALCRHNTSC